MSTVDPLQTYEALMAAMRALYASFPMTWRYAVEPSADPLHTWPDESWPVYDEYDTQWLRKNAPNWLYAEVAFPAEMEGIALDGTEARIMINGYAPFTLWVNGEEAFTEDHVWKATGPINDLLKAPITAGGTCRLILCLQPTERPSGSPMVSYFLHAGACQEMGHAVGAAALQLRFAIALAQNDTERAVVADAAATVDLDAVAAHDWSRAQASFAAMEQALLPLSPKAKAVTVHLVGHTHIDMDWMWTWADTVHCARRDCKAVIDMMDDYPDITFTLSQVPLYKIAQEYDPDVFAKIQARIAEGRWECAAGTWVEGDLNMADGESVARHMLYAKQWTREHLGTEAKVLWEPDTFGHPGNMPQLAKLGEFDHYFHWRGNPGRDHNWPARIWEGVDGTPVLAYSQCYGSYIYPEAFIGKLVEFSAFDIKNVLHIWGLGDHGGGLQRWMLRVLEGFRDKPLVPTITFSTMARYREALLAEDAPLRRNVGETYSLFEGCFTTHARLKWYNRRCEGALLAAEALSALAQQDTRATLRDAWTPILFNHFHDIFDGAAVHDSYEDAYARAEGTLTTTDGALETALAVLAPAGTAAVTLVNPLGFPRTEPVTATLPAEVTALVDADGMVLPVQQVGEDAVFLVADVPAFGTKTYRFATEAPALPAVAVTEDARYFTVETHTATLRIAKASGAIGSYVDKALGRELVGYGVPKTLTHIPTTRADLALNVFQILDEAPNTMSAWLVNEILREENLLRGAEVTLVTTGPVCAVFKVVHHVRASTIEEQIIVWQDFPRVDFHATVDWRERGNKEVGVPQLKVSFATQQTAARLRTEGPFYVTERPADGLDYPTQKWADLSGDDAGFALLNDSKHAVDALGGRLRLTLLRNSYAPDIEPDNGVHEIRFAFQPHGADVANGDLVRAGMAYNRTLLARSTGQPAGASLPFLRVEHVPSVVCTALRRAEYSDRLLVRLFESAGTACSTHVWLGTGIARVEAVNFLERPTGETVVAADGWAEVHFHPFEVKTLLIELAR